MKKNIYKVIIMLIIINIIGLMVIPISSLALVGNERKDKLDEIFDERAGISEAYKKYMELSDEEKKNVDFIPRKYNIPFEFKNRNNRNLGDGILPSSYVLTKADVDGNGTQDINVAQYGNIPMRIKNQNPYGLCWAFSSLNSLETNLAKKGIYHRAL